MQKSSMLFVITLLLVHAFLATPSVLATSTVYQCPLPTQPVGNGTLKAPVSRVAQGFGGIGLQVLPIPSPFGAGLKAIKFKLQVPCDTAQNFEATATATDDKGNTSDPLTFKFACEP
ncbi:hypothetical protein HY230_11665 [Candidatus Acetothermia bacterium]|nr:hypothetical protein [Candidatus Acetothermia bacterium]